MEIRKYIFLIFLFCNGLNSYSQKEEINLQLKWWPQFQFAGYYAAQLKGYYKDAGLKVNIIPGGKGISVLKEVEMGHADFGVSGAEILIDYVNGSDIQAIGAIFQHSPYVIISLKSSNIKSPADLFGKRVMVSFEQGWVQLKAMLKKEKISPSDILKLTHSWNNNDLINGYADAMSGYSSVEVIQLKEAGKEVNVLKPINYGIDFYGDVLFATRRTVKDRQVITDAFRTATFKGWQYAMKNKEEIADHLLTLPGIKERGITKSLLLKEANEMDELIVPQLVEIGHMNPGRWQHMLDIYESVNLVGPGEKISGFIYDPDHNSKNRLIRVITYILIAIIAVVLILFFYSFNMKKAVKKRTAELEQEVKRRKKNEEELRSLSDELQVSNNDLRQFAYLTSHNLRAPVSNMLSLIKLFNTSELTAKNALYFNKIETSTNNLNVMISDLNEILSVRNKEGELKQLLDLNAELKKVIESISEEIDDSNTLITSDFSKAPKVYYPRKVIHNIFQNLITNSIKYSKKGLPVHIDIICEPFGKDLRLIFSDNGMGINMQRYGDKVFGIYQRFNNEMEGKGLGLYIVKTQVEKYGGKVEVESEEDHGTKFIITLKILKPDE